MTSSVSTHGHAGFVPTGGMVLAASPEQLQEFVSTFSGPIDPMVSAVPVAGGTCYIRAGRGAPNDQICQIGTTVSYSGTANFPPGRSASVPDYVFGLFRYVDRLPFKGEPLPPGGPPAIPPGGVPFDIGSKAHGALWLG